MSLSRPKKKGNSETSGTDATTRAAQRRETQKKDMVMSRLRKARNLDASPEKQEEMALTLSNEAKMRGKYFRDLLESAREAVEEVRREGRDHRGGIRNNREQETCMAGIAREAHRVNTIEVKVAFRTLRTPRWQHVAELIHRHVKNFEYGAFHAAIIIGDTVLEWNDSSLVIPRPFSETEWAFLSTVRPQHAEAEGMAAMLNPVPIRANDQETNEHFDCIINKIDGTHQEKELLIDALVEVAVRYNTKLHYGVISNNCQHFVKDCLSVIGVSREERFPFEGKVRELADLLVRGGAENTVSSDFATHEELNFHVKENLEQMTKADIEFCLCLYHLFHASDSDMGCSDESCQKENLEKALEERHLNNIL